MNTTATATQTEAKPTFTLSWGPKAKVQNQQAFGGGRPSVYPWEQMGEPTPNPENKDEMLYAQFFVPGKTTKNFSGAAQSAGKRLHATFVVRAAKLEEPEGSGQFVEGVLVQRVEYREPRQMTDEEKAARKAKADANKAKKAAAAAAPVAAAAA